MNSKTDHNYEIPDEAMTQRRNVMDHIQTCLNKISSGSNLPDSSG